MPPPHRRSTTILTIKRSVRRAIERFQLPARPMKREPFQSQPESRSTLDFRALIGVSDMGRTVVKEVATLASLALFLGMVAIWAQVIAML